MVYEHVALSPPLAASEVTQLRLVGRNTQKPEGVRTAAKILLKLNDGLSRTAAAEELMTSWRTVRKTQKRYEKAGLEALLTEAPRNGRPPVDAATKEKILTLALRSPRPTVRQMAAAAGVSVGLVSKVLKRPSE